MRNEIKNALPAPSLIWQELKKVKRRAVINFLIVLFCAIGLAAVSSWFKSRYVFENERVFLYFNSYGDHSRPSFLPDDYHLTYNPFGNDKLVIIFRQTDFCGESGVSNEIGLLLPEGFDAKVEDYGGDLENHPRLTGAYILKKGECDGGSFRAIVTGPFFSNALGHISFEMYLDTYFTSQSYSPDFVVTGVNALTSIEMDGYQDTGVSQHENEYGIRSFRFNHRHKSEKIFWFRGFDSAAGSRASYELFLFGVAVGLLCSFGASAVFDALHKRGG